MTGPKDRLAELSPEKRKLLEMLARQKAAPPKDKPKDPAPRIVEDRWFNLEPGVFAPKGDIRDLYDTLSAQLDAGELGQHSLFLNWGYVPDQSPSYARVALPDKLVNKNPTRLVLEVIGDVPLGPEDAVLDVACGRGGTVSVLRTYFQAGRVTGLDLSPAAIAFCRERHRYPETEFVVGDSESLPFADGSMTVLTNVESSHCYPNVERFYREVFRVLRPGGYFCYTDVLPTTRVRELEALLGEVGFVTERRRDITSNVLLSCDDNARSHARTFEGNNAYVMGNFLAVPGSRLYNDMVNGVHTYVLYKLRRP